MNDSRSTSVSALRLCVAIFLSTVSLWAWSAPQEGLRHITKDYEAEALEIAFRADGIPSRVRFRECSACQILDYKVSSSASFYVNGQSVPLNRTRQLSGRSGAVIYHLEKQLVTKIIFF